MKNNKYLLLYSVAAGLIALFSFQNCSPPKVMLGSSSAQVSAKTIGELTQPELILLEKGEIILCPTVMCAAPPPNCYYDNSQNGGGSRSMSQKIKSTNNLGNLNSSRQCNQGCGVLVCGTDSETAISANLPVVKEKEKDFYHMDNARSASNSLPASDVVVCAKNLCPAPAPGCRFSSEPIQQDANGCSLSCNPVICENGKGRETNPVIRDRTGTSPSSNEIRSQNITPAPTAVASSAAVQNAVLPNDVVQVKVCPKIVCSNPPAGCYYKGAPAVVDGCSMGCGDLVCENRGASLSLPTPVISDRRKNLTCANVGYICPLPSPDCRYDDSNSTDAKGCSTGCGRLVCAND